MPETVSIASFDTEELFQMVSDSMTVATDGCEPIELDGDCEHGCPSIFIAAGLI